MERGTVHVLGTPDDPAAFTDFDGSNPVEVIYKDKSYYAFRLAAVFSPGVADTRPRVPRLVYIARPGDQPIPFGACDKSDDRHTVAARLLAFLQEHEQPVRRETVSGA